MRRAAALVVVLVALALATALTVGGTFLARQLAAGPRWSQIGADLEAAAERALADAIAAWDSVARGDQPLGFSAELAERRDAATMTRVWITRSSERGYWLVAESMTTGNLKLRRRLGASVVSEGGQAVLLPQRGWIELP